MVTEGWSQDLNPGSWGTMLFKDTARCLSVQEAPCCKHVCRSSAVLRKTPTGSARQFELFLKFIQKGKKPRTRQDWKTGGGARPPKRPDSLWSCDQWDSVGLDQGLTKRPRDRAESTETETAQMATWYMTHGVFQICGKSGHLNKYCLYDHFIIQKIKIDPYLTTFIEVSFRLIKYNKITWEKQNYKKYRRVSSWTWDKEEFLKLRYKRHFDLKGERSLNLTILKLRVCVDEQSKKTSHKTVEDIWNM